MAMARVCIVRQENFTLLKPKLLISDAAEDPCQAARREWEPLHWFSTAASFWALACFQTIRGVLPIHVIMSGKSFLARRLGSD
jgi:hypothetical protein